MIPIGGVFMHVRFADVDDNFIAPPIITKQNCLDPIRNSFVSHRFTLQ